MLLGLIAGGVLGRPRVPQAKIKRLLIAGCLMLGISLAVNWLGLCPVVKRIWTPSWTLFSGGVCLLLLTGFYG